MKHIKIILKTIILLFWMILIFLLSNQNGSTSSNLSSDLLYNIFKFFSLPDSLINDFLFVLIRKMAHFTEYFVLGILIINLLKDFKIQKVFIVSALSCLLYATLDEFHQLFISNRSGSIIDVIIDFLGALAGLFIYYIILKYKKRNI